MNLSTLPTWFWLAAVGAALVFYLKRSGQIHFGRQAAVYADDEAPAHPLAADIRAAIEKDRAEREKKRAALRGKIRQLNDDLRQL